jgi:CRP-like cAMP-binding protein
MDVNQPAFAAFIEFFTRNVGQLHHDRHVMADVARMSELRSVAKLAHIVTAGEPFEHLLFVYEGLIRYYYLDEVTGDERTGQFFEEGTVYTDVSSFLSGHPSTQYVQALSPCQILTIPRAAIYAAFNTDHSMERFGRLMLEQALIGAQSRTAGLMNKNLEERYRNFVAARPSVARRVPQYLIASFLGVTPEALARVRRRSTRVISGRARGNPIST